MAGTSLFHLESQSWARGFASTPIFEKTDTWSAARLRKSSFRRSRQGPHFPVLCPRLGQNIRPRIRFRKNQDLHGRLPRHVRFSQPMTRTALCSIVPQVCAETFVTTPISEKTIAGAGPVGHIMGPARATLFQAGGQNLSKLEGVLIRCVVKIEIAFISAQPSKMTTLWARAYAARRISTPTQNEPKKYSQMSQVVLLRGQKYSLEYLSAINIDTGSAQKLNENCCPNMSWEIFVAGPAAHREVFIFHTVWPGPRYPTLCP